MELPTFALESYRITASLIGSLAWPVALVVCALLFRLELRELLARMRLFRFAGAEAEFQHRLDEVRAIRQASPDGASATPMVQPRPPDGGCSETKLDSHLVEWQFGMPRESLLAGLSVASPAELVGMVLVHWSQLEQCVGDYFSAFVSPQARAASPGQMITGLAEHGLVDVGLANRVRALTELRNAVIHRQVVPSVSQAADYIQEVQYAIHAIKFLRQNHERRADGM
ncbi:hypothetical protein D3C86_1090850 [compost metagenome]